MGRLFSPGKLMLTSEYVALDGALVLSVPTRFGQDFFYDEFQDAQSEVLWEAFHQDKLWLKAKINYKKWSITETNLPESAEFIVKVLQFVQQMSATKFKGDASYHLKTNLQFPPDFGLGSSSTLMNNLAQWAEIDPFILNEKSLGGSGYDIAVAKYQQALTYQLTEAGRSVHLIDFNPPFKNELIFIHLKQKQNSREGIKLYRSKEKSPEFVGQFTKLTKEIIAAKSIQDFSGLMERHELLLSRFLGIAAAKELHFPDCPVFVKSLGAWGGDFVMSRKFPGWEEYFSTKGYSNVFDWDNLIK